MEEQSVQQNIRQKPSPSQRLKWVVVINLLLIAAIVLSIALVSLDIFPPLGSQDQILNPALIVNNVTITVVEYEDALEYFHDFQGFDIFSVDGQEEVKYKLTERVVLDQWAQDKGITVTDEQILEKSIELHENPPSFDVYPEFEVQSRVEVLKEHFEVREDIDYILWISREVDKATILDYVE